MSWDNPPLCTGCDDARWPSPTNLRGSRFDRPPAAPGCACGKAEKGVSTSHDGPLGRAAKPVVRPAELR